MAATQEKEQVVKKAPEKGEGKSGGAEPTSIFQKIVKTTEKVENTQEAKTAGGTVKEETEEEKKQKKQGQAEGGIGKFFKNLFKINATTIHDEKTRDWAENFAAKAKSDFKGYAEQDFAKDIVDAGKYDPKLAKRAINELYKAAKDKGYNSTEISQQVKEQEAVLTPPDEAQATSSEPLPATVTSIDGTLDTVTDREEYRAREDLEAEKKATTEVSARDDQCETGKEAVQLRKNEQMAARISSALVHFTLEDPMRVQAEQLLAALDTNTLHNFTPEQLKTLLAEWIPAKKEELSDPQKELVQSAQDTIAAVATDSGVNAETLRREAVQEVMQQMHDEFREKEVEEFKTPRLHRQPRADDTENNARTIDEALRNRRTEAERMQYVDGELKHASGTQEEIDKKRIEKAEKALGISLENIKPELRDEFSEAVITAHAIGKGENGADGILEPTLGNYTIGQIRRKYEVMLKPIANVLNLDPQQDTEVIREKIEVLMDRGILGTATRIRGDDPLVETLPTTEDKEYEDDPLKGYAEKPSFWQQKWEEIRKSPEIGEGPSRQELMGKLREELEAQLANLTDKDDVESFLARRLKGVWNERYANILARSRATEKVKQKNAQGVEEEVTVINSVKEAAELQKLTLKYQEWVDKVLNAKDTSSVSALKHEATQAIGLVMHEVSEFQNDAALNARLEKELQRPEDIADFGKLIMRSNPIKWGSRKFLRENPHYVIKADGTRRRILVGENPMFDDEDRLVEGNIMLWLTDRIRHLNDENPDEQISFFQAIDIDLPGMWRPIQVGSLLRHRGFFTDQDGQDMPHLYNEVTNLVWLIGYMRNADVLMRKGFLDQKEIMGVLKQLFLTNTLTKGSLGEKSVMEWFFTMPEKFIEKADPKDLDTKIGDAINAAFLTYYNVTDFEYLQENLGDLQMFMTGRGVQRALAYAISGTDDLEFVDRLFDKDNDETQDKLNRFLRQAKLKGSGKGILDLFNKDEKGNLTTFIDTEANRRAFVDFINPFAPYKKNQKALKFLRRIVEQGAAERAGLFKLGNAAKIEGPDVSARENDLRAHWGVLAQGSAFAELTAYFMGYPLGAGTRGQTGVEAINFLEKVTRPFFYLRKLESIERAGATGNRFTVGLLRGAFIDFVTGVPAVEGESITEILEKKQLVRTLELEGRRTGTSMQKLEEALQRAILTDEERGEIRRQLARKRNEGMITHIKRLVVDEHKEKVDELGRDVKRYESRSLRLEQEAQEFRFHAEVLREKGNNVEAEVLEANARALSQEAQDQSVIRNQRFEEAMGLLTDQQRTEIDTLMQQVNYAEMFKIIGQNVASRLQFNRNDSQSHVTQWENALKLYDNVIHGKEVEYAKFIKTTPFGFEIDQVGLQENVKNEWITPGRYTFLTNKMPMNKMRRNLDDNVAYEKDKNYKFETRPLVEELFNKQVLRVAQEIWTNEMNDPYQSEKLKKASAKFKGKTFLDTKTGYIKRDPLDKNKLTKEVNDMLADDEFNRVVLKAFLLCKFGGDLYSHTKLRTGAPHFTFGQREQAIAVLANISAGIHDDAEDFTKNEVYNYFFTKNDIKILRKISHNTFWKGLSKELLIEGGMGGGEGFFKGIASIFKHIFD